MENILIRGLSEEGRERLHEYQLERAVRESRFDDVDRLVSAGILNEERACEVLEVDIEKYRGYKAGEK